MSLLSPCEDQRPDEGKADGSIRVVDDNLVSYCLQLVVGSFIVAARVTDAEGLQRGAMAELRHLLDVYLRPEAPA